MNRPNLEPGRRLRFKSGGPTSGQIVHKSKKECQRRVFQRESAAAPPVEHLRPNDGPPPGDNAAVQYDRATSTVTAGADPGTSDTGATSGQFVHKSEPTRRRVNYRRASTQPRPSDSLIRDDMPPSEADPTTGAVSGSRRINRRVHQSKLRVEKTGSKLDAARERMARQKPYKRPGAVKTIRQAAGFGVWVKVHSKLHEAGRDNTGVEAAHRTELVGEAAVRATSRFVKRRVRTRPARQAAKWERRSIKAGATLRFRQLAQEHPKKTALSRYLYKKRIQRKYRKKAYQETKRAAKTAQKTAVTTEKIAAGVFRFVRRHPVGVVIALCCFLLIVLLQSCVGGALSIGNSLSSGVVGATSYLAGDTDMDEAELRYTEMETDLLLEALGAETSHPGYDEYRYNIGDISHNPYELMAYLTARYQDFTYGGVEAELQSLFAEQYTLTFTTETETRGEGEDASEWRILNVTVTAQSFSGLVFARMDAEQLEHYTLLMATKGNRQYLASPFGDLNWLPYVTSNYGYRVHPISGEKDYHMGLDIALPAGTEILAGQDGSVTFAGDSGGYGLVVVLDDGAGLVSKYAHCSILLVSGGQNIKAGDVIAKVGSTGSSTGPHLHLEVIKDGRYLNPMIFSITNDYGQGPVYGNPGAAMGDGSYEALIAEAESHLGKRYVFGANGPDTFDCSSFVCWTYTHSGVYNLPRTTAQGIYNQCTPVSPSEAQPGDLIFFHSTYSTSNTVTHVGIYVGDGMMIHCGHPVQYASFSNSAYWQSKFYAFGRLPT